VPSDGESSSFGPYLVGGTAATVSELRECLGLLVGVDQPLHAK
jgi:hypothetical protein